MARSRPWIVDQPMLLPPSVGDFVRPKHLALFVRDLVQRELDLSGIERAYSKDPRGNPPYHPGMMTALLLYAYCRGVYASRQIAIACEERVDFMALTGMQEPDFRTISDFRKIHRDALGGLFVQVLRLCREAGLAKLGHVALDGTKVKANASKHKAMSYARMKDLEPKLAAQVEEWMKASGAADKADDKELGAEARGDEMPDWVAEKQARLEKLREAKEALESAAKEEAEQIAAERAQKERETGRKLSGVVPKAMSGEVDPKAQRNFTDPESKILRKGSEYVQGYNAQAAVDAAQQVIVAADVVAQQNDCDQLVALLDQIEENTGSQPDELSADTGYCSEENLAALNERGIRGYVATGRQERGMSSPTNREKDRRGPRACAMRTRLRRGGWNSRYRLRKVTVEPVFGQIKERRGFRRFSLRGRDKVRCEWRMVCTAHNLLKLAAWSRRDATMR
jgi:transposase